MRWLLVGAGILLAATMSVTVGTAQRSDAFGASRDHPAIAYSTAPVANAVTALNDRLRQGRAALTYEPDSGYLRSVLDALAVPVESQVLVFSPTSFQAARISRTNPRAVYFNDHVAVGYVRGGDLLEIAVQDPAQGAVFYTLPQTAAPSPLLERRDQCLSCHLSWDTRAVPGLLIQTVFPRRSDDEYANGFLVDHRAPLVERWGGWFVTGARLPRSLANQPLLQPQLPESGATPTDTPARLEGAIDPRGYPTLFSDVVALLLLEHQSHATNLITRAGWEHRIGSPHVAAAVNELVDYLLFVDEAELPHGLAGSSGFAERFSALGPRDAKGRSLRMLDLQTRLMRYPLSYMIYSPGFSGLPVEVKAMARARLMAVLDGREAAPRYAHLTAPVRQAIREIVAETLPAA